MVDGLDQLRVQLTAALLLLAAACGGAGLENGRPTPEAAARAALDRLEAEDRDGLLALSVSEDEFRNLVYPGLPASRSERNTSADFLWFRHGMRQSADLDRTFGRFRGQEWELVELSFEGGTTDFGAFRVHRDSRVVVRAPDGRERTLRLFGSMLERGGQFKIYSFIVD